jgi:hypothetical protein
LASGGIKPELSFRNRPKIATNPARHLEYQR